MPSRYRHSSDAIASIGERLSAISVGLPLPGIPEGSDSRVNFIKQLIDSKRRVKWVSLIASREISDRRCDPHDPMFDPVRAAIRFQADGQVDEASWLIFLFVHFGKHKRSGWRYAAEVYGRAGGSPHWTWDRVSNDIGGFLVWLQQTQAHLLRGKDRGFGPHRRYASFCAKKPNGTGAAVQSYVQWVKAAGGHDALFASADAAAAGDQRVKFDHLYRAMGAVRSFGRLAKFDYLTMINKVGIAQMVPSKTYASEATGPTNGARLLLQGSTKRDLSFPEIERRLAVVANGLGVDMQVMEDSLCNWQKSPSQYEYFRG